MDSNKNIKVQEALPKIVFLLIVLQPLLDILSFWTNRLEMGNTLTLVLRFLMLVGFGLFGFSLSTQTSLLDSWRSLSDFADRTHLCLPAARLPKSRL